MKPFVALKTALSGPYLARAIAVMMIVGSVLNLINQGEALFHGAPLNGAGRFQIHRFDVLTEQIGLIRPYPRRGLSRIIEPAVPMAVNSDPAERH
jgi:hypothetical protein